MFLNCWKPHGYHRDALFLGVAVSPAREVERAIRIHQNLLATRIARSRTPEQALLALRQDYLRAAFSNRAEVLFNK